MESLIITALVLLAAIIVLFATKFLGNVFKVITKIFLLFIVILAILTIFVYKDIGMLKSDLINKKSIFILKEGDNYYAAVGVMPGHGETFDIDSFEYYTRAQLENLSQQIESGNMSSIGAGKVFVVTSHLLNKSYELDIGVIIDQNDMIQILKSNYPYEVLASKMEPEFSYSAKNLENAYGHEGVIKGYIFAALIINYFHEPDLDLVKHLKEGNLDIIPETITFKLIKKLPFLG
jgi:hypothetical protein